ncbi:MAG: hypothetical protein WBB22_00595 [Anaerolineae bacterium]
MRQSIEEGPITAAQLGLRDLPKGWRGAPLEQVVASAKRIVEQSEATGGSGDPRLTAALKVLEFEERLKAQEK